MILKHYLNIYRDTVPDQQHNQVYYLIKVGNDLKNEIADEEKMMIFNLREGFICRFLKEMADVYENFHHRHTQEITTKLINDEFDLKQFVNDGIIIDHFPLHDFEEMTTIYNFWKQEKWSIFFEPFTTNKTSIRTLNALSSYFGAEVGFFFVFLTFFTTWLLLPSIPGIIIGIYILVTEDKNSKYVPIYIIFLAVWATIFFEFWKRK